MQKSGMAARQSSLFGGRREAARKAHNDAMASGHNKDVELGLQKENEAMMDALAVDAARIKDAARGLRDEVDEHNAFLDKLASTFDSAKDGVKGTIGKIDHVMQKNGMKSTFICAFAIFLGVLLLWWLGKTLFNKQSGAPVTPPVVAAVPSVGTPEFTPVPKPPPLSGGTS